jgi:lysophospholipase L1-like esterase
MPPSRRLKLACGLAAVLLAASIATNLLLARALYDSFAKLQFARIFPLGYVPEQTTPGDNPTPGHSLSLWGDSRAFLWDKAALDDTLTVRDYAHGGITSSQLVLQLGSQPTAYTDYAVMQIGINDLHPLGVFGGYKQQIVEQLKHNILLARDALLERSGVVVLTTLFPPDRPPLSRRLAWDPAMLQYVREVNDAIRQATDGKRVLLLDAHALLSDADAYLAAAFIDSDFFVHVNHEAYSRLNERLKQLVREHPPPSRN